MESPGRCQGPSNHLFLLRCSLGRPASCYLYLGGRLSQTLPLDRSLILSINPPSESQQYPPQGASNIANTMLLLLLLSY